MPPLNPFFLMNNSTLKQGQELLHCCNVISQELEGENFALCLRKQTLHPQAKDKINILVSFQSCTLSSLSALSHFSCYCLPFRDS